MHKKYEHLRVLQMMQSWKNQEFPASVTTDPPDRHFFNPATFNGDNTYNLYTPDSYYSPSQEKIALFKKAMSFFADQFPHPVIELSAGVRTIDISRSRERDLENVEMAYKNPEDDDIPDLETYLAIVDQINAQPYPPYPLRNTSWNFTLRFAPFNAPLSEMKTFVHPLPYLYKTFSSRNDIMIEAPVYYSMTQGYTDFFQELTPAGKDQVVSLTKSIVSVKIPYFSKNERHIGQGEIKVDFDLESKRVKVNFASHAMGGDPLVNAAYEVNIDSDTPQKIDPHQFDMVFTTALWPTWDRKPASFEQAEDFLQEVITFASECAATSMLASMSVFLLRQRE